MNTKTLDWQPLVILDETHCPTKTVHTLPWKLLLVGWTIINIIYIAVQTMIIITGHELTQTLGWLPPLPATIFAAVTIPLLVGYTMTLSHQIYAWAATTPAVIGGLLYLSESMNAGHTLGWW